MLSIIIVNYNTSEYIDICLQSLVDYDDSFCNYEIIIVDNNSNDISLGKLKTKYPNIIIINAPRNGGFAYGNNIGIKQSSSDIILLLNPDTYVRDDSLNKMYDRLINDASIDFVGPKLLYPDGRNQSYFLPKSYLTPWRFFCETLYLHRLFPNIKIVNSYYLTYMNYNQERIVEQISGAAFMFRKNVIQDIGLLDENYFMYYEESDYCLQALRKGYKLLYYPESIIFHTEGASSESSAYTIPKNRINWEVDSIKYYFNKNFNKFNYNLSILIFLIHSILRALVFVIKRDPIFRGYIYKIYRIVY